MAVLGRPLFVFWMLAIATSIEAMARKKRRHAGKNLSKRLKFF